MRHAPFVFSLSSREGRQAKNFLQTHTHTDREREREREFGGFVWDTLMQRVLNHSEAIKVI